MTDESDVFLKTTTRIFPNTGTKHAPVPALSVCQAPSSHKRAIFFPQLADVRIHGGSDLR